MSKKRTKEQKRRTALASQQADVSTKSLSGTFSYQAPNEVKKKNPPVSEQSFDEQVIGYSRHLIYQDLLKTVVITGIMVAVLVGLAWYLP